MRVIHLAVQGQFDNIGDTMHRRVLLDWLREHGELRILVGAAPESFVQGLGLHPQDRVYRRLGSWLLSLATPRKSPPVAVLSSGEMKLGRRRALGEVVLWPFLSLSRLRGGDVLRLGIGVSTKSWFPDRLSEVIIRKGIERSTMVAWRTSESRSVFGFGELAPDLAFADGDRATFVPHAERGTLAVSMRFDRPEPSEAWVTAVKDAAVRHGLNVVVVTQVRRDGERNAWLADRLEAEHVAWPSTRDHAQQETVVREIYSRSRIIVSDRLHALIAGATEGANPIALTTAPDQKVVQHFDVLGLEVYLNSVDLRADELGAFIDRVAADEQLVWTRVGEAQRRLGSLRGQLSRLSQAVEVSGEKASSVNDVELLVGPGQRTG